MIDVCHLSTKEEMEVENRDNLVEIISAGFNSEDFFKRLDPILSLLERKYFTEFRYHKFDNVGLNMLYLKCQLIDDIRSELELAISKGKAALKEIEEEKANGTS